MTENGPLSMKINDNKAGMKNLDKQKINDIILDASKGSKYYENEMKREKINMGQIDDLVKKYNSLSHDMIIKGELAADKIIHELKDKRDFTRTIVHIDMDAFYAAAEMRDNAVLRTSPMAVGNNHMLATSNYLARKYGVRAGMPGFIATKLCPDLVLIEPDFDKYTRLSKIFRTIFAEYDPGYVSSSLDEAYLDLTQHLMKRLYFTDDQMTFSAKGFCRCSEPVCNTEQTRMFHVCQWCGNIMDCELKKFNITSWSAVEELRFRVFAATTLTCSAGIAANTMLAKIASDINKPNGQYQISSNEEDVKTFIANLGIRKVPGIGKVSERKLISLGISTCGDIHEKRGALWHLFKRATFGYFIKVALGDGEFEFGENNNEDKSNDRKSMSVERTFQDCSDQRVLMEKCKSLCRDICSDLSEARLQGKCVSIKLKLSTFELRTRAQTIPEYTDDVTIVTNCACELLQTEINANKGDLCLRLLGVRICSLINEEMVTKKCPWTISSRFPKIIQDHLLPNNYNDKHQGTSFTETVTSGDKDGTPVQCPLCSQTLDLAKINKHLDRCLSVPVPSDRPSTSRDVFFHEQNKSSPSSKRTAPESNKNINSKKTRGPMDKFVTKQANI